MARSVATSTVETSDVVALADVVAQLRDEVKILRQVIDEFREDFTHCLRNLPDNLPPPYAHLGSMLAAFTNEPLAGQRENSEHEDVEDAPEIPAPAAAKTGQVILPSELATPVMSTPAHEPTPQVTTPTRPPAKKRKHKQPLYMRMVMQPILTDLVRMVGYIRWETNELRQRVQPLVKTYGQQAVEQATKELLSSDNGNHWRLSDAASQHAYQIIGKRPQRDEVRKETPVASTDSEIQSPPHHTKERQPESISLSQQESWTPFLRQVPISDRLLC